LKQTAIANPHLSITYKDLQGEEILFARGAAARLI
jgi:DNA topoisomerase VI subunit B